jgi:adenosylhomocysteine nucleosidase
LSQHRSTSFIDAQFSGDSSSNTVVLFAATRWELAALRRAVRVDRRINLDGVTGFTGRYANRAYRLVLTGIGPEAADFAARAVLNREAAALAVSAGFAGALMPAATVGDVIVATSVVSGRFDGTWNQSGIPMVCEDKVRRSVQAAGTEMGVEVRSGPVLSLPTVVCRAVDKQNLGRVTGAVALDMESAAIGKVAQSHGIPFAVVRTVSDVAGEDLPLDFNAFLHPSSWVRGIGAIVMNPSSLIGLNRLRRQSRLAAERLTAICAACAVDGFGLSAVSNERRI